MKIIVISGSFEPHISPRSFRTTELVKELALLGHDITLYIPNDGIDRNETVNKYKIKIKYYIRLQDRLSCSNNKLIYYLGRFLVYYMGYPDIYILKFLKNALKEEARDYDLLITIAAPHQIHWTIGLMYNKGIKLAKKWIADCGDPYMLAGTLNRKHPFYFKQFEMRWCRLCDYISVPTEGAKDGYYSEFRNKIRVIPQAFNFDEIKREEYKNNIIPTFAYTGSIWNGSKDPRPFLDYLCTIKQNFRFYLFVNNPEILLKYKNILKDKIIISSFIPRLDLINRLSKMDFLVHFEFNTSKQTPSKLIDYALSGRPILSIDSLRINKTIIEEFLNGDYSHKYVVKDIEQYNIKYVAEKILNLCL